MVRGCWWFFSPLCLLSRLPARPGKPSHRGLAGKNGAFPPLRAGGAAVGLLIPEQVLPPLAATGTSAPGTLSAITPVFNPSDSYH